MPHFWLKCDVELVTLWPESYLELIEIWLKFDCLGQCQGFDSGLLHNTLASTVRSMSNLCPRRRSHRRGGPPLLITRAFEAARHEHGLPPAVPLFFLLKSELSRIVFLSFFERFLIVLESTSKIGCLSFWERFWPYIYLLHIN